jgi:hypothetical protein
MYKLFEGSFNLYLHSQAVLNLQKFESFENRHIYIYIYIYIYMCILYIYISHTHIYISHTHTHIYIYIYIHHSTRHLIPKEVKGSILISLDRFLIFNPAKRTVLYPIGAKRKSDKFLLYEFISSANLENNQYWISVLENASPLLVHYQQS